MSLIIFTILNNNRTLQGNDSTMVENDSNETAGNTQNGPQLSITATICGYLKL